MTDADNLYRQAKITAIDLLENGQRELRKLLDREPTFEECARFAEIANYDFRTAIMARNAH